MSRAFVKEDVDPPERSGRVRSASGLPPGALNYITASGAARLKAELEKLQRAGEGKSGRIEELKSILESATIVEPPAESSADGIAFGARVTVRNEAGESRHYRIVGVDEMGFEPDAVSWISPIGRALLAASLGAKVKLDEEAPVTVVDVVYP